jgi:hypothetical protein
MLSGTDPEIYTDVLLIPDRSEAHFIQLNVIKMSLPYGRWVGFLPPITRIAIRKA